MALASGALVEEGEYVRAAKIDGRPLSRPEALELWSRVLAQPAGKIIEALGNEPATKEQLAGFVGYSTAGGYFRSGLRLLRQNGVVIESGDQVRLANPLPGELAP